MGTCERNTEREAGVEEREFEQMLERMMQQDLSAGTQGFRDALLERCIATLHANDEGMPLDDADLEMLAAAGVPELTAGHAVPDASESPSD